MRTTIVLVHGAFAESESWDGVIEPLVAEGHRVVAAANPLRGLAADAAAVTDLVRTIEGPVVLVAHSYGGAVISNVDADAGDIAGLVYVNGFAPEPGETCFQLAAMYPGSMLGEETARPVSRRDGTTDLYIAPDSFHDIFCQDVPAPEAALMAATQRPATQEALVEPSAVAAPAVMVPDRRGGPHHPRRAPAPHGPPRPRAAGDRGRGRVARDLRLASRCDGAPDPGGRRAAGGRVDLRPPLMLNRSAIRP